jgi:aryl-alcohol dehydrogenase-like predicted oxidoreductase
MKRIRLGSTEIEVSRLGIGTGTAHPSGHCAQALMGREELSGLLVYAFEHGINFWDTAFQYNTHLHVREALKTVKRKDVVITTKLITSGVKDTIRDFHSSLKELNIDYLDVCLVHGVRTERELRKRSGALDTLLEFRRKGWVRAVGISSHGLSALRSVLKMPEIDLVLARINFAGICVDRCSLGLYDQLASVEWLKKSARLLVPKRLISVVRTGSGPPKGSLNDLMEVENTLKQLHSRSKAIVGMKVMAEGRLGDKAEKALTYVNNLPFVDSFIVGMLNNCLYYEDPSCQGTRLMGGVYIFMCSGRYYRTADATLAFCQGFLRHNDSHYHGTGPSHKLQKSPDVRGKDKGRKERTPALVRFVLYIRMHFINTFSE